MIRISAYKKLFLLNMKLFNSEEVGVHPNHWKLYQSWNVTKIHTQRSLHRNTVEMAGTKRRAISVTIQNLENMVAADSSSISPDMG